MRLFPAQMERCAAAYSAWLHARTKLAIQKPCFFTPLTPLGCPTHENTKLV
jgi:hypothetical protein